MIKILNKEKQQPRIYHVICDCGCEFECEDEDLRIGSGGASYVICPRCHTQAYVSETDNIVLTEKNIEFPTHFYHFGEDVNSVDIKNDQIQEWVRDLLCKAKQCNNPCGYYGTVATGNVMASIHTYEDNYEIRVAKNYWECTIPKEMPD